MGNAKWYQWHNWPAAHAFQACDTHSVSILHDVSTPTTHPTTSGNLGGVLCFLPPRVGCAIHPPQRRWIVTEMPNGLVMCPSKNMNMNRYNNRKRWYIDYDRKWLWNMILYDSVYKILYKMIERDRIRHQTDAKQGRRQFLAFRRRDPELLSWTTRVANS